MGRRQTLGVLIGGFTILLIGVGFVVYRYNGVSGTSTSCPPSLPKVASSDLEGWQADLSYLVKVVKKCHPSPFASTSEVKFTKAVAKLKSQLPALGDGERMVKFASLVAMLGDGHTKILLKGEDFLYLPVRMHWFRDELYVVDASEPHRELVGQRITRIGSIEAKDVRERIGSILPAENASSILDRSQRYLSNATVLQGLGFIDDSGIAVINADGGQGGPTSVTLKAVSSDELSWMGEHGRLLPLYEPTSDLYQFRYEETAQIAYLRVLLCREQPNRPFSALAREMFETLDAHPDARLVVDLRHNGGGSTVVLQPLLEGVRSRPRLQGKNLVVLIGRHTYSSGMIAALELLWAQATLVGEATGGKPNFYGESMEVILPNSKLTLRYSTKYFELIPGKHDSVVPQRTMTETAQGFFQGKDVVLDLVRNRHEF